MRKDFFKYAAHPLPMKKANYPCARRRPIFEHYHDWGLLYRQFLSGALLASGRADAVCDSHMKTEIAAQADLFATFDAALAGSDTLARARADNEIWCAPEVLRATACRILSGGDKKAQNGAEAVLLYSLKLAQRQDAKAWELRTATTIASFYLQSGRAPEARAVLEPALAQIKQGHDTRDVQAAINVLSALSV
jgi:hypothetical protein